MLPWLTTTTPRPAMRPAKVIVPGSELCTSAPGDPVTTSNGAGPDTAPQIDSSGDCCLTPDGRFVLSGSKKDVLVWNIMQTAKGQVLKPDFTLQDKREAAVIAFNPRYNFFASADQELLFWLPDPHG